MSEKTTQAGTVSAPDFKAIDPKGLFKAQFTKRMRPWYVLFEFKKIANANG